VTLPPRAQPRHARRSGRRELRLLLFVLIVVGLVAIAADNDWGTRALALGISAVGLGLFYARFPNGAQFGAAFAVCLAMYTGAFIFLRDANFPNALPGLAKLAQGLPPIGFILACAVRHRVLATVVQTRRTREVTRLPPVGSWLLGAFAIGALSFVIPNWHLTPLQQSIALLVAQVAITAFVVNAARDVTAVVVDMSILFEDMVARVDRLLIPMLAFLSLYAVIILLFASLYRIADIATGTSQFVANGQLVHLSFVEALYYSLTTIATVGFGDITPATSLVRALSGLEVIMGVLMLLFGFSEIMRSARPGPETRE
jgi:voltage-gated potassium channel